MRFSVVAIAALFLASHISAARTEPTQLQIGTRIAPSVELSLNPLFTTWLPYTSLTNPSLLFQLKT